MKNYLKIGIAGLLIVATFMWFNQAWAATLIDSFTTIFSATATGFYSTYTGQGQTFTSSINAKITSVEFYGLSSGTPTGNIVAVLYALNSGCTYGTNCVPTGSALATSNSISASSISSSVSWITFTFSGANQYAMSPGYYGIVAYYTNGSGSNTLYIATEPPAYSTATGNAFQESTAGSWSSQPTVDTPFYVYGTPITTPTVINKSATTMQMGMAF